MNTDSATLCRRGRGRPKQFNREQALDKALELFWRHGYESTSLADLVEATQAKAPTLYGEFGNKEGLFRAAIERYVERLSHQGKAVLEQAGLTTAQAINAFLRTAAANYTDKDQPAGCFIICTSSALSSASDDVAKILQARHHLQEHMLADFLAQRQQSGQLSPDVDSGALAKYLTCTLQGMAVQARDGASLQDLEAIISTLMAQWSELVQIPAYN